MLHLRRYTVMLLLLLAAAGCGGGGAPERAHHSNILTLATTTSMQDTGLLDELVPVFEQETGLNVRVIAVGTGQALELGRRGDADVLMTHAPSTERKFIDDGYARERRELMYNDFVLVGPAADPAEIADTTSIADAFRKLAETKSAFVSRGDESGTHIREREIWSKAGIKPAGDWYVQAGTGMTGALRLANEKQAYVLTDRGTWLTLRDTIALSLLSSGDASLRNQYSVLLVDDERHPGINHVAAAKFADFLTRADVRRQIGEFGRARFGEPLFHYDNPLASTADDQRDGGE